CRSARRRLMRIQLSFFFFQAEDGIRDLIVTGVQTCALPIFTLALSGTVMAVTNVATVAGLVGTSYGRLLLLKITLLLPILALARSEERRVGKEGRSVWSPGDEKKNRHHRTISRVHNDDTPTR